MTVLARLRPDVTPDRARLLLQSRWPQTNTVRLPPGFREEWRVRSLRDRRVGDAARLAWLLMGAVVVFLLIACVNVTNLMLARVGERRREFAVRAAIGAGRMRLARLALAESLLLALAAGGIGLVVAFALLDTFVTMAPPGIPGIADASIDLRVFVVAALLVVVTGTAVGVWPAISVFRVGAMHGLRSTAISSRSARPRVRFALVTTQIALTLALLGGSALLLRSLWNVVSVPLGFDAERIVTLSATLSRVRYPTNEHGAVFFEDLLARARATPGALSVALSDSPPPPLSSGLRLTDFEVEGRQIVPNPQLTFRVRWVTPQYFETFRIPLVRGRTFQEIDATGEPAVALHELAQSESLFAPPLDVGGVAEGADHQDAGALLGVDLLRREDRHRHAEERRQRALAEERAMARVVGMRGDADARRKQLGTRRRDGEAAAALDAELEIVIGARHRAVLELRLRDRALEVDVPQRRRVAALDVTLAPEIQERHAVMRRRTTERGLRIDQHWTEQRRQASSRLRRRGIGDLEEVFPVDDPVGRQR